MPFSSVAEARSGDDGGRDRDHPPERPVLALQAVVAGPGAGRREVLLQPLDLEPSAAENDGDVLLDDARQLHLDDDLPLVLVDVHRRGPDPVEAGKLGLAAEARAAGAAGPPSRS